MRISRLIPVMAVAVMAFAGCSTSPANSTEPAGASTAASSPSAAANTLTVAYEENCQLELIAPSGQRILIDVYDPTLLTSPAKATDILLATHIHTDHYLASFADSFPGKKIVNETKEETIDGVKIKSIAASHDDQEIVPADPTNHIFVIEFNGFKIVHMGSTGQMKLTADQLTAIGTGVDIAAVDMVSVGGSDPNGDKEIQIAQQINAKLIVPTHSSLPYIQAAGKIWSATYSTKISVKIPQSELPTKPTMLIMGNLATSYGSILKAPESKW